MYYVEDDDVPQYFPKQDKVKPLWEDDANKLGGKWVVFMDKKKLIDASTNVADLWMKTVGYNVNHSHS